MKGDDYMSLEEALKQSREARWEQIRRERQQEKKEFRWFMLCVFLIFIVLIIALGNMQQKSINDCIKKGFAENVCIANL